MTKEQEYTVSELKIEKNVPLPKRLPSIPFDRMKPGDSVLLALRKPSDINTVRQRVWRANKKGEGVFSSYMLNPSEMRVYRRE